MDLVQKKIIKMAIMLQYIIILTMKIFMTRLFENRIANMVEVNLESN